MNEYKPNSHRSKEEGRKESSPEKKVEKVVTGVARSKKKNEMQKMADVFIQNDLGSVKSYIFMDVLLPALKKALSDIVTNGIDMLLYGESGGKRNNTTASRVSYRSYYDKQRNNDHRDPYEQRARGGYSYNDVVFESRGDAEAVLEHLDDLHAQYGIVSVADLYDLADIRHDYTDNKYGWTDISSAVPVRTRDGGYVIKLPRAMPIN